MILDFNAEKQKAQKIFKYFTLSNVTWSLCMQIAPIIGGNFYYHITGININLTPKNLTYQFRQRQKDTLTSLGQIILS